MKRCKECKGGFTVVYTSYELKYNILTEIVNCKPCFFVGAKKIKNKKNEFFH